MTSPSPEPRFAVRNPKHLSPRVRALRDLYFEGVNRTWNNEFTCWTTGTPWDVVYDELTYHIVPETYPFFDPFRASARLAAREVPLPPGFFRRSLIERRAWFIREVMVDHVPHEILPGSLLAGGRFNILASRCFNRAEARAYERAVLGPDGARPSLLRFHRHGYGNAGATSGHLIPDYPRILRDGFRGVMADLEERYAALPSRRKRGREGRTLSAMMIAASMPRAVASKYAAECRRLLDKGDTTPPRRDELARMAAQLDRVPHEPAKTFWEAVQSLWLTHMLVMSDENYPGPGLSFGRLDQYLLPYWQRSLEAGEEREFLKEILRCFFVHANTVYDAMIRVGGNQGITAGFGQLFNLSGVGAGGRDMTNDLTFALLEVIDEMSPILEPKPNVRLHQNSPDHLLDKVVDMIAGCQGAPFLLNFDERSMAGLLKQAEEAGVTHLIHPANVHDYAAVGCLENTMAGNDRSGTVDINLNLLKAVELALTGGRTLAPAFDPVLNTELPPENDAPNTGDATRFTRFEEFWDAYARQTAYIVARAARLYEKSEATRAAYCPTPYLSCLVGGCAEQARDITQGGAALSFVTVEGVTFATTVDSLLAIRYLVFETGRCTMDELIAALRANFEGHETLQAWARFRAPKFGRDEDEADAMALAVMELWTAEVWRHRTLSTGRQFRPGMLSWNYWVGDGYIMAASADGRPRGQFLSNAICPTTGADTRGPTANANSVGKALGGVRQSATGKQLRNLLPNGASHTMTFSPDLLRDRVQRDKFKAFLRGYASNGGTALQVNVVDASTLREAQRRPRDFRHLLVRVTGYNAYFTSIGRELQDEIIARESHKRL